MGFELVDRWPGKFTFAKSTCEQRLKKVRVLAASVAMGGAWKAEGTVITKTLRKKHVW